MSNQRRLPQQLVLKFEFLPHCKHSKSNVFLLARNNAEREDCGSKSLMASAISSEAVNEQTIIRRVLEEANRLGW